MHYYTFHIGDYSSHTSHLDEMEDLAYRRMLDSYYLHQSPLPKDVEQIARIIRMRSHCECIANVLHEFFVEMDDGWHSIRADAELAKMIEKSEKAQASAKARWDNAKKMDANALQTQCEGNATNTNTNTNTNNQEPNKKKTNAVACPADVSSDCWEAFIAHRKAVKALVTDRVVNSIRNEADKAGIPLQDALDEVVARGWKGFKAEWYKPMIRNEQPRKTQYQLNQEATARALGLMPQRTFDGDVYDVETVTKFLG